MSDKKFSPKFYDAESTPLGKLQIVIHVLTSIIETVVSLVLVAGIVVALLKVPTFISLISETGKAGLKELVAFAATIIIVVEFIHVIVSQNLDSVIEIVMLAITRELVINEYETWELLAGVLCIAALFAIKKFLLVDKKDK